nr:ABC transporter permease subunit [Halopolyspora algeriensis]
MTAEHRPASPAASRFVRTLAAEWTKLWSLRFTRAMLLLALILAAGAAAVFLLTTETTRGEPLAEMSPFEIAGASLLGVDFAVVVLEVLCASAVASEYSTGMIRLTLSVAPHRWRVLAAKGLVATMIALLAGLAATAAAVGAGQLVLLTQGLPGLSPEPRLLRLAVGSMLMVPLYSLLTVALAFLTRNGGGAIAVVLTIMSVPTLVGALPPGWQWSLLPWLPASALHSLSGAASPQAPEHLAPGWAAVVLVAWAAALLLLAYVVFSRRDA